MRGGYVRTCIITSRHTLVLSLRSSVFGPVSHPNDTNLSLLNFQDMKILSIDVKYDFFSSKFITQRSFNCIITL